eukprot:8886282-Pyramimonas_sp.AAC.1
MSKGSLGACGIEGSEELRRKDVAGLARQAGLARLPCPGRSGQQGRGAPPVSHNEDGTNRQRCKITAWTSSASSDVE